MMLYLQGFLQLVTEYTKVQISISFDYFLY